MYARWAEADAEALDFADAEALADQRVEPDAARDDVAAALDRRKLDTILTLQRFQRLDLDQRQLPAVASVGVKAGFQHRPRIMMGYTYVHYRCEIARPMTSHYMLDT